MSRYTSMGASYVAQGHRSWMGVGLRYSAPARIAAKGHNAMLGSGAPRCTDNQADLIPQVMAERQRRALYAGDDRAPEFTSQHRNFYRPGGQQ